MTTKKTDIIIVGAGFAGLYAIYRFQKMGLSIRVLDAASDVGGTWYWNRYPGARCDVPSLEYSFGFSESLEQEWHWPEVFSAQPDILQYANHVADRFDLRKDIQFNTRVVAAEYAAEQNQWTVTTDAGEHFQATYCVMATGCLSIPVVPDIEGADSFGGLSLHTGQWPKEEVDLSDMNVGIIGTGSSGVQTIPELASMSRSLTVFQRTPVYTVPANRKAMRTEVEQEFKDNYRDIRARQKNNQGGVSNFRPTASVNRPASDTNLSNERPYRENNLKSLTEQQRITRIRERGLGELLNFQDVYTDTDANEIANELYRDFVRYMVNDPDVAEKLLPRNYGLGCKRQVLDRDYYATFNLANVSLVDLQEDPLVAVTKTGIQTSEGHRPLDAIVYATGFDAMTGALTKANIRGREGRMLADKWAYGPEAYLGLQMAGFPNLFTITGPGSPSVLCNMLVAIEQHVDWIADCIGYMSENNLATIEPTEAAEQDWISHVNEVAVGTMYTAPSCNSWYLGANIPGKPRIFMPYVGGFSQYREKCEHIVAQDYLGFQFT
jgi:cation diffusion facilitator CzcD-associated flavoprotein CzcO